MSVDRPTFSESWYRVAALKPRLRCTVQTYRQHYRGRMWQVMRDPATNQFYRVDDAAYTFIAMLDGKRTVAQAWEVINEKLGDRAPTQGEVIQTLGQLYAANLLQAELAGDAAALFDRYKKRVRREVQSYLMNLLFMRIPLIDPERFLDRWVGVFGWAFSLPGLALWGMLLLTGLYFVVGRWDDLARQSGNVLDVDNLVALYLSTTLIKLIHEFGHGFSCKAFGRRQHSGGEVHTMGVMLMVLIPLPYVDASSSWALRSKWQRAVIAAAGMYVELAVAAVAAIVWAQTNQATTFMGLAVNDIAFNVIFVASVTTILFNANPLLRYDGYYILSDLAEIPNLAQRSKDYFYYLVKRYAWGMKRAVNPAQTHDEKPWLAVYAVASSAYRVFVSFAILLFVADQLFFLGVVMAVAAVFAWVVVPLYKLLQYLATSPELLRNRQRAVLSTAAAAAVLAVALGLVPIPEHGRAEGVVEARQLAVVRAGTDGFVSAFEPSGVRTQQDGAPLLTSINLELEARIAAVEADRVLTEVRWRQAVAEDLAAAQVQAQQLAAIQSQLERLREQHDQLKIIPAFPGVWVSPQVEQLQGAYVKRGEAVGLLATVDDLIIRAVADQRLGPRLREEVGMGKPVSVRVRGRPEDHFTGRIEKLSDTGGTRLPSVALGSVGGGAIHTREDDPDGLKAAEPFFEVQVNPDGAAESGVTLYNGQRVVVRFRLPGSPIAQQLWRSLRQLVQRRFQM